MLFLFGSANKNNSLFYNAISISIKKSKNISNKIKNEKKNGH